MHAFVKIAALLGAGIAAFSAVKAVKRTKNTVCSPLMQDFFDQAADELKNENPNRKPTDEEVFERVGKKVREFQNKK